MHVQFKIFMLLIRSSQLYLGREKGNYIKNVLKHGNLEG